MLLGFIEPKTIFVIAHLFGVAIGMGGAFMSDAIFFSSIKDRVFTEGEIRFIKLGSRMVWLGVVILILSGIVLVSFNPELYLNSSKFLTKLVVVGVIIANGLYFHHAHIPLIERHQDLHYGTSHEFRNKKVLLAISGAVSLTSWSWALILGAFRGVPYSFETIMIVYLSTLLLAILVALALVKHLIPEH